MTPLRVARRGLTEVFGALVSLPPLRPLRDSLLASVFATRRPLLMRLASQAVMSYWCRHEYFVEPDPECREKLKGLVMGGVAGAAWAERYALRPVESETNHALSHLDRALASAARPVTVVQVGSSSGRELAWLARRHPAHRYCGVDPYPEVVEFAARRQAGAANVRFVVGSAKDVAAVLPRAGSPVVVFSSGALQYVQPEHLPMYFSAIASRPETEVLVVEPTMGDPFVVDGSRWREAFTPVHNYRFYAERAGLDLLECAIVRTADRPLYFYLGRSRAD